MTPTVASTALSPRRAFFPTERSDLTVTWHPDQDRFVVALWRDGRCVGTAPLRAGEAGHLAAHISALLGHRA